MSAIECRQRGGFTPVLDRLREGLAVPPSRRGDKAAAGDAPRVDERAGDVASACTLAGLGAIGAHALFARALRENSNLEQDWLWLSTMVDGEGELCYCLERALYVNQHSAAARRELTRLARHRPALPRARWPRRRR